MAQITIPAGAYLEDDEGNPYIPSADMIIDAKDCGDGFYEVRRGGHVYTIAGNDVQAGGLVLPQATDRARGQARYDRRSTRWLRRGR